MPGRKTISYKDYYSFNGGLNNTSSIHLLDDNELSICENMIIKQDNTLQTRYGTKPIHNPISNKSKEVTRRYEYISRGKNYLVEVINNKLYDATSYDYDEGGMPTIMFSEDEVLIKGAVDSLNTSYPTFLQQENVLYVFDGKSILEIGQIDYYNTVGTVDIKKGDLVELAYDVNNKDSGKIYEAKTTRSKVDLTKDDYRSLTNWVQVHDIERRKRLVKAYDPSKKEKASFTFFGSATQAGKFEFKINDETYSIETTSTQANADAVTFASYIKTKAAEAMAGKYTVTSSGATVTFEAITPGYQSDLYLVDNTTKITCVAITNIQGKENDNVFDEVCQCTTFAKHTKSARYVATGNPNKPYAVYFSEPNQVNYWKNINILYPTTGEGKAICLLDILSSMLVGYDKCWYEYTGLDPGTDGTWRRLAIPYGCIAKNSVQIIDLYHFIFLGYNGLNVVSSNMLNQYMATMNNDTGLEVISLNKVNKEIGKMSKFKDMVSIYRNNIYYLAYKTRNEDGNFPTSNNTILTYNTKKKAFTIFKGLLINDFCYRYGGQLEFASYGCSLRYTDTERVAQGVESSGKETLFYKDYDYTTNRYKKIVYKIRTGILHLSNIQSQNFIDKIHFKFIQNIEDETKHIKSYVILDDRRNEFPLLSNVNNFVWGNNWGDTWGKRQVELQSIFVREKCQHIYLEITNEDTDYLDSNIEFMGFTVSYKPFIPYQYISNLQFS